MSIKDNYLFDCQDKKIFIVVHDGIPVFPKMSCNQKGYTFEQAKSIIEKEGWLDAVIFSVVEEIKRYNLKGNEIHRRLLDSETYAFETWWKAYMDRNISISRIPIRISDNAHYENTLKEKLDEYIAAIEKPAFVYDTEFVESIKKNCRRVLDIFSALKDGNEMEAEEILMEYLIPFVNDEFIVSKLNNSYAFRGVAPFTNLKYLRNEYMYEKVLSTRLTFFRTRTKKKGNKEKIKEIGEIVHIPYNLLNVAKEMRFSKAGEPCLYLGTTSFVCAKECRWDEKTENLYGSVFIPNERGKELKILNLILTQYLADGVYNKLSPYNSEERKNVQLSILRLYPIVLAMSFTISQPNRKYKYEYYISQFLMKIINKVGIDGIAYLSAQGKDEFQYPQGVNLALPAYDISREKQYSNFCSAFKISKPVKFDSQDSICSRSFINEIYSKHNNGMILNEIDVKKCSSKIKLNNEDVFYEDTKYGKFDNFLCSRQIYDFEEVIAE